MCGWCDLFHNDCATFQWICSSFSLLQNWGVLQADLEAGESWGAFTLRLESKPKSHLQLAIPKVFLVWVFHLFSFFLSYIKF